MSPAIATRLRRSRWWYAIAAAVLLAALALSSMIGPAGNWGSADWNVMWNLRLPRVVLAGLVGATLSLSGASYQGVFRNPLVDPYLLGVAAGAGLGATIVFAWGRTTSTSWPIDPLPLVAFLAAVAAVALTYLVGASFGSGRSSRNNVTLVLAGVAVTALATAIQAFILQRHNDVVKVVYTWILGRVSTATWADVRLVLPYLVVSGVVLLLHRRHLDVLRVGDDEAAALGTDVRKVRLIVVVAATLGTAAAVSVSGLIGFVGIVVPHLVRLLAGTSYRRLLPLSVMFGAAFLILADLVGRTLTKGGETPIGVVTAFIGAPFFIIVLRTRRAVA